MLFRSIAGTNTNITLSLSSSMNLTSTPTATYTLAKVYVRDYNTQNLVVYGTNADGVITPAPDLATGSGPYTGTMTINHASTSGNQGSYGIKVEYYNGSTLVAQSDWMLMTIN